MPTVKGNHPLSEIIAKKLFGIKSVPPLEAERMISRACRAAVEWHENHKGIDNLKEMNEWLETIMEDHITRKSLKKGKP